MYKDNALTFYGKMHLKYIFQSVISSLLLAVHGSIWNEWRPKPVATPSGIPEW
jgi:hypothetical protein